MADEELGSIRVFSLQMRQRALQVGIALESDAFLPSGPIYGESWLSLNRSQSSTCNTPWRMVRPARLPVDDTV